VNWLKQKKQKAVFIRLDRRTLYALAALLFLSQLPHVLHLPVWVSGVGMMIVAAKLYEHHKPNQAVALLFSPVGMTFIAFGGAALIRLHYGYFLGRDPCVAFLFILVSAKFAEVRRSSEATLLLCLCGFLLLTQYFYSQSILSAIITLPAVIALGNALAVIRDSQNAPSTKHSIKTVIKLLVQGAPLAALLFMVFPRLPGPLWSLPNDAVATTGLSDSMSPGSIGALSKSDAVAFRIEFKGTPPAPEQRYWRGPVLNDFDGKRWTTIKSKFKVQPNRTASGERLHYTVTMQPTQMQWLFSLDHPVSLPMRDTTDTNTSVVLAHMSTDLQLTSFKKIKSVTRYTQISSLSDSFKPAARPSPLLTQLSGNNPKSVAFAKAMRAEAGSDRAYVKQLLSYFNTEPFRYTLKPSLLGDSPVDEFLFSTRNGFCEHYASAFVVLLRAAAIPSRVVTGYLGGEMNGDYMIVRQSDAHAWAEAYLDGRWVRFDPTGAVAPSRVEQNMASALGGNEPVPMMARRGNNWLRQFKLGIDELNYDWQRLVVNFNNDSQYKLWQRLGLPKLQLWQITVAVLLLTAIWCVFVLGFPLARTKTLSDEQKLWNHYVQLLSRYGIDRLHNETPNGFILRAEKHVKYPLASKLGHELNTLRFKRLNPSDSNALKARIRRNLQILALHSFVNGRRSKQATEPTTV